MFKIFKTIKAKFTRAFSTVKEKSKKPYTKTTTFIKKRPLGSFAIVLGLLLAILIVGRIFGQTEPEKKAEPLTKNVKTYTLGESPKASFQAKVEKEGVVRIIAQAPGVVMNIPVTEGQEVGRGNLLVSLASNYQGGNAASVQRQIAQAQYQNVLDTFGTQKNVFNMQRDVATNSAESSQKLRDIAKTSAEETGNLINANQKQLDEMKAQLAGIQSGTIVVPSGTIPNPEETLPGTINQLQGGIYQLNNQQRTTEYQSKNENAPARLETLQKDIALRNLDVQEKGLELNKEVTGLQATLASINEATMYPVSPFAGVVERVFVKIGQLVNPGDPIATVSSADTKATVVLTVPQNIASAISLGEASTIEINGKTISVKPYHISSEATDGTLYSVFYEIPKEHQGTLSDGEFIQINVPINTPETDALEQFIPIDAVYQTQETAFVLVNEKGKAKTRELTLGSVYGNYVEVRSGLKSGDQIILDRNVVAEDKVKVQ